MKIYVNGKVGRDGDGTKERPFRRINDAAKIARPGDEVLVSPGVYREYVDPIYAGTEEARISYRSTEHLGAVITGAERIQSWTPYKENVWVCRVANSLLELTIRIPRWYMETGILPKQINIRDVCISTIGRSMRQPLWKNA